MDVFDDDLDTDDFTTTDMGIVSYLKLRGCEAVDSYWEVASCRWVFEETPQLRDFVFEYVSGQAMVEAGPYFKMTKKVRDEFFRVKNSITS